MNYRNIQRATVARSALDVIALVFLACAFAFWSVAFWQLLAPPAILSLWSVQAVVLALVYALATPLLWSMLVPTTPAGQMLQKTQLRTVGFVFIVGSAIYLSVQAEWMIESWLYAQPRVAESGMHRSLAISLSIAFILIPALAWVQLTPERWLQQIQQAHQVKKLEMQQKGELAIIKASLVRAETLAAIGWANLLPLEKEEAINSMRGLLMASSDSMRAVVRTLGLSAELEREIMDDEEIATQLDYVKKELEGKEVRLDATAIETAPLARVPALHQNAAPISPPQRQNGTGMASPPRPAAPRRAPPRYAAEYEAMLKRAGNGVWGVGDLAVVIGKSDRSARDRIAAWMDAGLVARDNDGKNVYYFTEDEA